MSKKNILRDILKIFIDDLTLTVISYMFKTNSDIDVHTFQSTDRQALFILELFSSVNLRLFATPFSMSLNQELILGISQIDVCSIFHPIAY